MFSLFRRFQSHRKLQKMLHCRWQRIFVRTGHYINWAEGGGGFPHKVKGRGTGGGRRGTLDIRRGTRDMRRGTRAPTFGRAARPFAAVVPGGKHAVRAGGRGSVRAVVPGENMPPSGRAARPFVAVVALGETSAAAGMRPRKRPFCPLRRKKSLFFSRGGLQRGGNRCILYITPEIPGDAPWKRNSAI